MKQVSHPDDELFIYVVLPGDIHPHERGERFADPLQMALQAAELGEITGAGSQLDDPYPDGRPRVEFCGLDIELDQVDGARQLIMRTLQTLGAPPGTELHYTAGDARLLDRFTGECWNESLPRTMLHPAFGI